MKKIAFFIFSVFLSFDTLAVSPLSEFLIEPYVGTMLAASATSPDDTYESTGNLYGLRFGFYKLGFSFGLDARLGEFNLDVPGVSRYKVQYVSSHAFYLSYELPIMLRFWGEYIFSQIGKVDSSEASVDGQKLTTGGGTRFGVGYKLMPLISLNLEYVAEIYAKLKDTSGSESDSESSFHYWLFSVSIPLVF